jgi:hypothetical protein
VIRIIGAGVLVALFSVATSAQVLLVPDWTGDKVWAFDPTTGAVVNNNFIPDDGRLDSPKNAIDSGRGTILVSDQINDSVFEYGYNGLYIQTIAGPANGLDNIRGIAVSGNSVYVTVGGNAGGLNNTIQKCDLSGAGCSTYISANLNSPFDVYFRSNDILVSNSTGNLIQRYDLNGSFLNTWHSGAIRFPQQILNDGATTDILIAGFSPPSGVYRYDANGAQIGAGAYVASGFGPRGGYRLGNGQILATNGTTVTVFDPASGGSTVVATGGSFQYIEYSPLPEPATLTLLALGGWAAARRRHS